MIEMQSPIGLTIIAVECGLLCYWWLRVRTLSVAPMIMLYLIVEQCIFLVARSGGLDDQLARFQQRSFDYAPLKVILLYLVMFSLVFCSTVFLRGAERKRSAVAEVHALATQAANMRVVVSTLVFAYVVVVLNAIFLKLGVVWENTQYLLMTSPDAYNAPPRLAMALKVLMQISGIALSLMAPIAVLVARRQWAGALMLVPWCAIFLFQLGAHSRFAGVMLALLVATASLFVPRFRAAVFLFGGALVLGCLIFALEGRGLWVHGVGAIGATLHHLMQNADTDLIMRSVFNFLEGIFATGDGILLKADYPAEYKALSFSPLFSALDHFDKWLACCEVRLNVYTPMSAVAEVVHFGGWYWVVGAAFLFLLTRHCHWLMAAGGGLPAVALNLLAFVYFMIASSYPVRNVFRFMLAVLVVAAVLRVLRGRRIVLRTVSS